MHNEVKDHFRMVKKKHPQFFWNKKILEVGSLYVNGSIRQFFWFNKLYLGLDIGEGKNVDLVCPIECFEAPEAFDVVASSEMLEHSDRWQEALTSMYECLKPKGLFILTCAAPNREPHGVSWSKDPESSPFTNDYYRNISIPDFESVLPRNLFTEYNICYGRGEEDL